MISIVSDHPKDGPQGSPVGQCLAFPAEHFTPPAGFYMCTRVPTCTHMYPHVPTCTHMYPHVPTCTHMYPHVPTCTHMYPHVPTCTHMYPHVPTCTHMYPHVPTYLIGVNDIRFADSCDTVIKSLITVEVVVCLGVPTLRRCPVCGSSSSWFSRLEHHRLQKWDGQRPHCENCQGRRRPVRLTSPTQIAGEKALGIDIQWD